MKIELINVIPFPIKNELQKSGLWGEKVFLNSSENTLIDARSGKGKSTFTSFLAGTRFDYEGAIFINGKDIRTLSRDDWSKMRRNNLAFIFQDLQLFDKLTVKENLIFKNSLTDFKSENEILQLLKSFSLENKWTQYCGTLSLGQQQRIAIIRSLLQPADFLIMDEPFSHLDEFNTEIAVSMIKDHCYENQIGIILTTLGQQYTIKWDRKVQIA